MSTNQKSEPRHISEFIDAALARLTQGRPPKEEMTPQAKSIDTDANGGRVEG